ncbi:MAG TPA: hypothetical protein VD969_21810 [Symbiobacteriaceae bacterium]|nr:hypothetical protein [Symbiobacteriaceae bacterium]
MFTLQNLVIALALVLFAWYFIGVIVGRQRGATLVREIRSALEGTGKTFLIKWFGRSAFQVDVSEPASPLKGLQVFCLLEPRDFALALAWNRIRRRRDQVIISASYMSPPPALVRHPLESYGIPGLSAMEVGPESPHVRLTLQVGVGNEGAIRTALEWLRHNHVKKRA